MPTWLSDVAPNERPIFVPRLLGQQPSLAALVAETISTWSYAEHALGRSVAAMSRGINSAQMEDYIADWRLPSRLKIVRRIARAELQDPYLVLFMKALDIIQSLAHRRHAFAHGVWGAVEALPDALLLVAPEHLLRHWGQRMIGSRHLARVDPLVRSPPSTTVISRFGPRPILKTRLPTCTKLTN